MGGYVPAWMSKCVIVFVFFQCVISSGNFWIYTAQSPIISRSRDRQYLPTVSLLLSCTPTYEQCKNTRLGGESYRCLGVCRDKPLWLNGAKKICKKSYNDRTTDLEFFEFLFFGLISSRSFLLKNSWDCSAQNYCSLLQIKFSANILQTLIWLQ